MKGLALMLACVVGMQTTTVWPASGDPPLRVCADPDNLPFTSNKPDERGLYLDLAQRIAERLERQMTPVWAPMYRPARVIRTLLLGHRCDMLVGVPAQADFMAPRVIVSEPILDVGYVLVTPRHLQGSEIADFSGKRVAVQFDTPGQDIVAERVDVTAVTVTTSLAGLEALAEHRADAAILWGPEAGYLNKTMFNDAYRISLIAADHFQFKVGIAFARRDKELRDRINAVVAGEREVVSELAAKYGVPGFVKRAVFHASESAAQTGEPALSLALGTTVTTQQPVDDLQARGRAIFNSMCAHCHGAEAITGVERQNLRHLQHRYGDEMDTVFLTTATNGRPAKGMPSWKAVYSEDDFKAILAFLRTVQEP